MVSRPLSIDDFPFSQTLTETWIKTLADIVQPNAFWESLWIQSHRDMKLEDRLFYLEMLCEFFLAPAGTRLKVERTVDKKKEPMVVERVGSLGWGLKKPAIYRLAVLRNTVKMLRVYLDVNRGVMKKYLFLLKHQNHLLTVGKETE